MSTDSGKKLPSVAKKQKGSAWSPVVAIAGTAGVYVAAQFVVGILLGFFFGFSGWSQARIDSWLASTLGQFAVIAVSGAATIALLALFLHLRRIKFQALGFSRAPQWRDAASTAAGFFVYFGLLIASSVIAAQFLGINTQQEQEIGFEQAKAGASGLALVFLSLVIIPPIVEETLFRGFLYGGLRSKMTMWWAAGLTSVMFAVLHLFASSEGLLWIAAIDTFILSIVLCYVRERTGALWAAIGIHAIKNSLAFIVVFVVQ
ncbi:MAG: lysostaphin resistance A-like protein [Candidatus Saccharimonadales bacterium]